VSLREFTLGSRRVTLLDCGRFSLSREDIFRRAGAGGAPPVLPPGPDAVVLALNAVLVRTPRAVVVIDTGLGRSPRTHGGLRGVRLKPGLLLSLEEAGVAPADVDFVIATHLHYDHCGGSTVPHVRGGFVPSFPKARYVIQQGEWDAAFHPGARDRANYIPETFAPLAAAGAVLLVEGGAGITEGVEVVLTPGHTAHHQSVLVHGAGRTLCVAGDLIPTAGHAGFSLVTTFDLDPRTTLRTKRLLYERAVPERWIFALPHDLDRPFGRVVRDGARFAFRAVRAAADI